MNNFTLPLPQLLAPAPRTVDFDLRVTLPATTPMVDVAAELTRLATALNGTWCYRHPIGGEPVGVPRGRFEVEAQP